MFYEKWMSYIKDDTKITKVAIPGAHNAATKGMIKPGRCQNGTLYEQYQYGVREFGIRLKSNRKGKLYIAHGLTKGMLAEEVFADIKRMLEDSDEFFVFDMKTYPSQNIGPIRFGFEGNTEETNRLIREYLSPEKYALTDVPDISTVTIGDIRRSGKRYIILNSKKEYEYSSDCELLEPWDPKIFGLKPEVFAKECLKYLKELETNGFFWFQTQQTPNIGTDVGLTWPADLDKLDRPLFPQMMADIAADPVLLEKVNIVAGDFMTADYMKANEILNFNLIRDFVKDELREEYAKAIGKELK